MRFFGLLVSMLLCMAVAACGGGGSDSSASNAGGGGSGSSGSSTGGGSSSGSACGISSTDSLVAISFTGVVGSAQFASGGSQLNYSGGLNGSLPLVQDGSSSACMDSAGSATSMRTAMQTGTTGMGVSHVTVGGVNQPALLLNSSGLASNSSLAALQGSYVVLRNQQDTSGGGQTRMSYASFTIDGSGNWSMCKNAANCSSPTATGSLSATSGSSTAFDLSAGGLVRAKVYLMGTGANRVLVVAEDDTGGGSVVTGIWVGMPQSAWAPVAGTYVVNSTDATQQQLTLASTSLSANSQSHALTADSPITGLAVATATDTNYLLATPSGVLVTGNNTNNNFSNGPAYFSFGVKP